MSNINPQTALQIAQGTQVAVEGASAYMDAKAARDALALEAKFAEVKAQDSRFRANAEAAKTTAAGQRGSASVRAQVAGSGFTVGVGTAGDLEGTPAFLAALDAATIRENGRRETLAHQTDAAQRRAGASSISPWANGAMTLAGGASRVASYWYERNTLNKKPRD